MHMHRELRRDLRGEISVSELVFLLAFFLLLLKLVA